MKELKVKIDEKDVIARPDQTILSLARENGIFIPTLCHSEALEPAAMCRLCMVELYEGGRKRFVTSCNFPLRREVEIKTDTPALRKNRKLLLELLMARCPESGDLKELAEAYDADLSRFSSLGDDCVLCGLCARVCEKVGGRTLTLSGRGVNLRVSTPFGEASSFCIGCGACVQICPVNAITITDEDGERVLRIHGREAARIKLPQCTVCRKHYGPVIDLAKVMSKLGHPGIPAVNADLCPECARRKLAVRLADRYYDAI